MYTMALREHYAARYKRRLSFWIPLCLLFATFDAAASEQIKSIPGITCQTPPLEHCGTNCDSLSDSTGNAYEPQSGRRFFLDYPCDLKQDEQVTVILNLHGAGSNANWQRHYFPASEYKERYRLVIATPTAATSEFFSPIPVGFRSWNTDADEVFLEDLISFVFQQIGRKQVKALWIVGHSQGAVMANKIACSPFFKNRVDGLMSFSGGRIGGVKLSPKFPILKSSQLNGNDPGDAPMPSCNLSYIFVTGAREILALPKTSPWAEKYRCRPQLRKPDIYDEHEGFVTSGRHSLDNSIQTAEIFTYDDCKRGKLVADIVRIDKHHADGIEPHLTQALIEMMLSAPKGKLREFRWLHRP